MKFLADLLRWFFFFPLRKCLSTLPNRYLYLIAKLGGQVSFYLRRHRRQITLHELTHLFPEDTSSEFIVQGVKHGFVLSLYTLLQSFSFPKIRRETIGQWITLNGKEHIDLALKSGHGVLLVLVHFGANQMVMPALGFRGYTINQLGSKPDDWSRITGINPTPLQTKIFNLRLDLEKHLPANFIYIDRSMRPIYECLNKNQIMIMAADGRAGKRFVSAPFFRKYIHFSSGPFRISKSTGSALIPVFSICRPNGIHDLVIEPAISVSDHLGEKEWVSAAASELACRLESRFFNHPSHYCMLISEAQIRAHLDPVPLITNNLREME